MALANIILKNNLKKKNNNKKFDVFKNFLWTQKKKKLQIKKLNLINLVYT
jgi:hypothetical protein